jgi:hypothetical protein
MLTNPNDAMAQTQNLLDEGGMLDNSGEAVNGVEVPPGSLREEVADDVPAMLSEGEFVVPADVVRYIGLEKLMKMRDQAKAGLERMEEMGQMGNAEEVVNPDQPFDMNDEMDDVAFERDIDSILGEVDSEQTPMPQGFAKGGVVGEDRSYISGDDITKATGNPVVDVRYYKHEDGRLMYVTHINGRPMTSVPEGFAEVSSEEARQVGRKAEEKEEYAKAVAQRSITGGGGGGRTATESTPGQGISLTTQDVAFAALNNPRLAAAALSLVTGLPTIVTKPMVEAIAKASLNDQNDKTSDSFKTLTQLSSMPGVQTMTDKNGNVIGISSPASIAASDAAMFGAVSTRSGLADIGGAAQTGMGTLSDGRTIANAATIEAQNRDVFGPSTSASRSSGGSGGYSITSGTSSVGLKASAPVSGYGLSSGTSGIGLKAPTPAPAPAPAPTPSRSGGGGGVNRGVTGPSGHASGAGSRTAAKGGLIQRRKKTKK